MTASDPSATTQPAGKPTQVMPFPEQRETWLHAEREKFLRALGEHEDAKRQAAILIESLGQGEPNAANIEPATKYLTSQNSAIRAAAAKAIGQMGPAADRAVRPLIECVRNGGGDERAEAITALGRIGPGAQAAVGMLCGMLADLQCEQGWSANWPMSRTRWYQMLAAIARVGDDPKTRRRSLPTSFVPRPRPPWPSFSEACRPRRGPRGHASQQREPWHQSNDGR